MDPVREDSLVGAAELSRAGQHAAAIDPHRKTERAAVLERQLLGGQLGRAVERQRRLGRETSRPRRVADSPATGTDPAAAETRRPTASTGRPARAVNRIDAARAQQDEPGPVRRQYSSMLTVPSRLCSTSCRELVVPVDAGEHAGIGGGIDHPVHGGQRVEVARQPDVAVHAP